MRPAGLLALVVIMIAGAIVWWTSAPHPEEAAQEYECTSCDNRKKGLGKLREALSDRDSAETE